jgi:RluA family pseudouridine synthase
MVGQGSGPVCNISCVHLLHRHIVPEQTPPSRLSDYACGLFPTLPSRKSVKKAVKKGEIWIDGSPGNTGDWVKPGQRIELMDLEQDPPPTYEMPLEIVYEDEHLAVVNKPAGIPTSGNRFRTVQNALTHNLSPTPLADALPWPVPVHRLDASTSGLLLIAKTRGAHIRLGRQFEEKQVRKKYQAVVIGQTPEQGRIDTPIEGKEALTLFERRDCVPSLKNEWLSLLDLYPHTGRTHQLRIHLSSSGYPILGDKLYGREGLILRNKGLFLAAVELSFEHPDTQKKVVLSVKAPRKFRTLLEREERRWRKYQGSENGKNEK